MKNLLDLLCVSVVEISNLLFVSEYTLHSWFKRRSSIPLPYSTYLYALDKYQTEKKPQDLELVDINWQSKNQNLFVETRAVALKELNVGLDQSNLSLMKLKKQEHKLISRIHLAENYLRYLPEELQNLENTTDWIRLLGRRSRFDLYDIKKSILKLEQKIVGLKAQIMYWETKKIIYLD